MSTTKKDNSTSNGKGAAKRPDNELPKRDSPAGSQSKTPGNDWNGLIWDNLKLSADIPREIRDEIYSYLALCSESTKYTPTTDQPPKLGEEVDGIVRGPHSPGYCDSSSSGFMTTHTYAFNIAMLLVNNATKADVEEYIIKTNKFVLVEHSVPLIRTMLSHCAVPMVADQHLWSCRIHSVLLRLEWSNPPAVRIANLQESPSEEWGRILLTWNDFPKLCRMLKFMCQYSDPRALYIMNDRHNQLSTQTSSMTGETPSLLFNITRQLSSARQTELVNNILTIVGGGYRLEIFGVPDDHGSCVSQQMRSIMTSTGPHLIWAKALLWDKLHTAFELKREADKLAENGHIRSAQLRYFSIVEHFTYEGDTNILGYFESPSDNTPSDGNRKALQRSWYGFRSDLCLSIAAVDIIRTQAITVLTPPSAARDYLRWLIDDNRERSFSISNHELAQRVHMRALVQLAYCKGFVLSRMLNSILVREFLENVQSFPEYATSRSRADYDTLCGLQQKLQQVTQASIDSAHWECRR